MPDCPKKGEKKKEWIGKAIKTYRNEGYPEKQAIAMAYSKWDKCKKDGN